MDVRNRALSPAIAGRKFGSSITIRSTGDASTTATAACAKGAKVNPIPPTCRKSHSTDIASRAICGVTAPTEVPSSRNRYVAEPSAAICAMARVVGSVTPSARASVMPSASMARRMRWPKESFEMPPMKVTGAPRRAAARAVLSSPPPILLVSSPSASMMMSMSASPITVNTGAC